MSTKRFMASLEKVTLKSPTDKSQGCFLKFSQEATGGPDGVARQAFMGESGKLLLTLQEMGEMKTREMRVSLFTITVNYVSNKLDIAAESNNSFSNDELLWLYDKLGSFLNLQFEPDQKEMFNGEKPADDADTKAVVVSKPKGKNHANAEVA